MTPKKRFYAFIAFLSSAYCYGLYKAKHSKNELVRIGASGSLTMTICDLSLYSIESINARSKVLRGENVGFTDMTRRILQNEGISGMYKGYSASFYSIMIHGFVYFYIYKALKNKMKEAYNPQTTCQKALVYGFASVLSQSVDLLCYPLEMIRIRLLTMNDVYHYSSVSDAFQKIVKSETWRGLYRGSTSYMVNLLGVYSISMTIYELYIDAAMKRLGMLAFKDKETRHVIEASVISSVFTVLLMNAFEVVVVRRQSGS